MAGRPAVIPKIVSDNGCQPTSRTFGEYKRKLGVVHVFTSYDNPKGDADTERVIRTLKEDLRWLNECKTIEELQEALNKGDMTTTMFSHTPPLQTALLLSMRSDGQ